MHGVEVYKVTGDGVAGVKILIESASAFISGLVVQYVSLPNPGL